MGDPQALPAHPPRGIRRLALPRLVPGTQVRAARVLRRGPQPRRALPDPSPQGQRPCRLGREEAGRQGRWQRAADHLISGGTMSRAKRTLRACGWVALALGKAGTVAFTLEGVLWPDQRKYKGKAMRIRSLGYFGGLALVPAVWVAGGRGPRYPLVEDLAMTAPLLVDAAGNSLGIYDSARIDDVVHFMNAVALAGLFGAAISNHVDSRERAAAITVVFGL